MAKVEYSIQVQELIDSLKGSVDFEELLWGISAIVDDIVPDDAYPCLVEPDFLVYEHGKFNIVYDIDTHGVFWFRTADRVRSL